MKRESIGFVIKTLRKNLFLTQSEFGHLIETDAANVSRIETGKQDIPVDRMNLISEALDCPIHELYHFAEIYEQMDKDEFIELINNQHIKSSVVTINEDSSNYVVPSGSLELISRIPLISWVQAGDWEEVIDNLEPGVGEDWVPTTATVGPHAYALLVNGDSMEPEFPNGSIIIVDPDAAIVHNAYVIVRLNESNEATFKQYVEEGGNKFLKPVNPRYPILEIKESATFCGRVVMSEKKYI